MALLRLACLARLESQCAGMAWMCYKRSLASLPMQGAGRVAGPAPARHRRGAPPCIHRALHLGRRGRRPGGGRQPSQWLPLQQPQQQLQGGGRLGGCGARRRLAILLERAQVGAGGLQEGCRHLPASQAGMRQMHAAPPGPPASHLPAHPFGAHALLGACCRPVQPQSFGVAHLAAVSVLTYTGAFCAVLLAAIYGSQVAHWQVGGNRRAMVLSRSVGRKAAAQPMWPAWNKARRRPSLPPS